MAVSTINSLGMIKYSILISILIIKALLAGVEKGETD
jgi:hypothetical protein